jgi:sulfotransferase
LQAAIHFISDLPPAGSTLLSAILRQNPRFRAGMTGPVGSPVEAMLRSMSMSNETSIFINDTQREALLRAIFATFYADVPEGHVVFDTNRLWCTKRPLLAALFPKAG